MSDAIAGEPAPHHVDNYERMVKYLRYIDAIYLSGDMDEEELENEKYKCLSRHGAMDTPNVAQSTKSQSDT